MRLSKLPLLLLTSLSLLASVSLLSCSNSSGSGGGDSGKSGNASGNITAKATDKGIEVTAKNLSANSRVDIYRIIGDDEQNEQWFYMTNNNSSDTVTVLDEYVNVNESYTYILAVGGWEKSNTVKATHGKGELSIQYTNEDDGVLLDFGNIDPTQNYFEISHSVTSNGGTTISFNNNFSGNTYKDELVSKYSNYTYQARIIVKGDRSGNVASTFAYTRPFTVKPKENTKGGLWFETLPEATYDPSSRKMTFTEKPEYRPSFNAADIEWAELAFYVGGQCVGNCDFGDDYFIVREHKGTNQIDGYCISLSFKNGVNVQTYAYNMKDTENPFISVLPKWTDN